MTNATTTRKPVVTPAKRPAKPTKPDPAVAARAAITSAHAQPRFDLATEAWIPVVQAGSAVLVSLRDLFTRAHLITDLAVRDPLRRAAMRRFLEALTIDLVRRETSWTVEDWEEQHGKNQGFTAGQVERLLDVHGEHLWLWHPTTPFLQDPRLITALDKPHEDITVRELLPHLPSKDGAAWSVKPGDPMATGALSPAETALGLVARWFYTLNCICARLNVPGVPTLVKSHVGSSFADSVAGLTHVFRVDNTSLYRSLLRGIPAEAGDARPAGSGVEGCAWLDPQQPQPSSDPLYLATLNPAAVLLTARDERGETTRLVRAAAVVAPEVAKGLRTAARDADQHRATYVDGKKATRVLRITSSTWRGELMAICHRDGTDGQPLRGVISSDGCWLAASPDTADGERLDLLFASKVGAAMAPRWQDVLTVTLPARHGDPAFPDPRVREHVRAVSQIAFAPHRGVPDQLREAFRDLLARPKDSGWDRPTTTAPAVVSLTRPTRQAWMARIDHSLDDIVSTPDPAALAAWEQLVWRTARDAFDRVAARYSCSPRYAARYALAMRRLTLRSTR